MQNGASTNDNDVTNGKGLSLDFLNGDSEHLGSPQDDVAPQQLSNGLPHPTVNSAQPVTEANPRGQKRKLFEHSDPKRGRHVSPPWKKIAVEGPTTFVENGRRKSARTNTVPLDLQPPTATRQTRAGHLRKAVNKPHHLNGTRPYIHKLPHNASSKRLPTKEHLEAPPIRPVHTTGVLDERSSSARHIHRYSPSPKVLRQHASTSAVPGPNIQHRKRRRRPSSDNDAEQCVEDSGSMVESTIESLPTPVALRRIKSLRLNYRPRPLPVLNPGNLVRSRRHASLNIFLSQDDALEGDEEQPLTVIQATEEARVIRRLEQAARPGGLLSEERWTGDSSDIQDEPLYTYTHPDYLLKHVMDFQPRLERERAQHIALAKRLAFLAYGEWKRRQPQTEEEIWEEKRKLVEAARKKMLSEFKNKWEAVKVLVEQRKHAQSVKELENQTKEALKEMLDKSAKLVAERRRMSQNVEAGAEPQEISSGEKSGEEGYDDSPSGTEESEGDTDTSSSGDTEVSDPATAVDDERLTAEELERKYRHLHDPGSADYAVGISPLDRDVFVPCQGIVRSLDGSRAQPVERPHSGNTEQEHSATVDERSSLVDQTIVVDSVCPSSEHHSVEENAAFELELNMLNPADHELDEVDHILLDDSDVDEDDESDNDNEDDDTEDGEEVESSEGEDAESSSAGLLGFFSKKELQFLADEKKESTKSPSTVVDDIREDVRAHSDDEVAHMVPATSVSQQEGDALTPVFTSTSDDASRQMSPATTNTAKPSEVDSMSSVEPYEDIQPIGNIEIIELDTIKTEVPSLLRGELRIYQHAGLDWLAGMYANRTNGILADEMGLGKTIQTIALLAHLATEHHVWGPHLIIVPTSVMLNWEMEFKKWCPGFKILTYYGTQEERKLKRRGWMDNDRWHVCITSYQLALQDASSLKRRSWHCMVLDEAHNIKNFRSQRWQTLLHFKTEARLLLTGTPLQNNLTELWSLLFFLDPGQNDQGGFKFADLSTFSRTFHRPVEQILEHGREDMDDEARELVTKLHKVLRPHLLRRLKADVEKQMPKKYEHIVKCRLSKRQRQLYDGYMGLAGTRESFQSGNYLSIINCLMQLRKVCNHPDLFETRQIVTSYAMPRSAVADYEIKELLLRKRLVDSDETDFASHDLLNLWHKNIPSDTVQRCESLAALPQLARAAHRQHERATGGAFSEDCQTVIAALACLDGHLVRERLVQLQDQYSLTLSRSQRRPVYGSRLLDRLTIVKSLCSSALPKAKSTLNKELMDHSIALQDMITTLPQRAEMMQVSIKKFGCVTPAVVAPNMARLALTDNSVNVLARIQRTLTQDLFYEARTRLSIAFPDKSLIQYDCGKLQQLDRLLRNLQAGGHRALIFTQMTKVLDILEQFLNLHGHRYLRLDGATKIEQRQVLTDRFNNDTRILAFILSSRSGGLGINLTGADTVIFYDLDWNPAMDKQCQDRCHRIGQTRDVHIYRFVSEGTIEANILRKSNQKRMLDDVVIQEGDFTTDYFNRIDPREFLDENAEADAALDKVLGGAVKQADGVFEQVEDKEDRDAARTAQKEFFQTDDADFEEKTGSAGVGTPKTDVQPTPVDTIPPTPAADISTPVRDASATPQDIDIANTSHVTAELVEEEEPGSYEEYMLRFMSWEWRDVVIKLPSERQRKKSKKGKDHTGIRIRR